MKILSHKAKFIALFAATFSMSAHASYTTSVDGKGCWDGLDRYGNSCLSTSAEWAGKNRIRVTMTNRCGARVYAKFCNQRSGASPDCGASGIVGGGTKKWASYNATGRYKTLIIGSTSGSKDWVCADQVRQWRNNSYWNRF